MKITVVLTDGTSHEVEKFAPVDLVSFEREFKTSASVLGEPNPKFEWLCYLVWRSLIRTRVFDKKTTPFDDFLDLIADLDVDDADETVDENPTESAAPSV